MPMLYNESKHDAAVARRAVLEGNINDLAARMVDEQEGRDGSWSTERLNGYMALNAEHSRLSIELTATDREISRWDRLRPQSFEAQRAEPTALARLLRNGYDGLGVDERAASEAALEAAGLPSMKLGMRGIAIEMVTVSDAGSGEEAVDTDTQPRIVARLANFGGARRIAQNWSTERGNPIKVPRVDASQQKGRLVGTQATAVNDELALPDIGETSFEAYTYTSDPIKVSNEAIQDIAFDIGGYIEQEAVRRLGRITNDHFTSGTGSDQPTGFAPLALRASTAAAAAAVSWQEVLDLQYDVDDAYLEGGEMGAGGRATEMGGGMTGYTMSRSMEQLIRKLADSENRPLWIPGLTMDSPNMIHGYPYVLNYSLPAVATGVRALFFGNFSYFVTRSVQTVAVYDFWDSRTAQRNQREVLAFCRDDSNIIGPVVSGRCPAFAALTQA